MGDAVRRVAAGVDPSWDAVEDAAEAHRGAGACERHEPVRLVRLGAGVAYEMEGVLRRGGSVVGVVHQDLATHTSGGRRVGKRSTVGTG